MKSKSSHISIINSLRGIAALSVCLYHFVCTTTGYITNQNLLDIFHYGAKGVQVFFIISGIVIPLSMIKSEYEFSFFPKFILKRFIRIEPPYIGVVILGIIYLIVRNYIPSSADVDLTPSLRDVFLHLGYLVPFVEDAQWINPVFWTLSIEFQYYLILALTIPLFLNKNKNLRFIFYGIILVLPLLINSSQAFYPYWSSYFALGIFYVFWLTKKINKVEFFILIGIASIVVVYFQGFLDLGIGYSTLLVIHYFKSFTNKIGNFFGNISYSLYLLHSIIGSAFVNFMSHRFTAPVEKFFVILIGVIITIFSAYIYWRLVEKPSQKLAQKIKLKRVKHSRP